MTDGAGWARELARILGGRGGRARAKKLTAEKRKEIAAKAGKASAGKKNGRKKGKKKKKKHKEQDNPNSRFVCFPEKAGK